MIKEHGELAVGIEFHGTIHKDFTIRPALVRDSVEAIEISRARQNDSYLGLCTLARQIEKIGAIPKDEITADLLMDMYEVDLSIITEASRRLQKRQRSFRSETAASPENHTGNDDARPPI